jgi:SAM-dependent methyltransferase
MSHSFGSLYSSAYDDLYRDKDYDAECDLLERIFQTYGQGAVERIIDLGCGTGNHAVPLARRGYDVTGVDGSAHMLIKARQKLEPGGKAAFEQGDLRAVRLDRQFDSALMMFAVLGYQTENQDVISALKTARAHVRPGGLLVFDVWYGPAVLHLRPSERVKLVSTPEGQILRASSGELETLNHVCVVHYHVWLLGEGRVFSETEEHHRMRYFFPLELDLFLRTAGFDLLRLGVFPQFERDPDETSWNVLGVARAV